MVRFSVCITPGLSVWGSGFGSGLGAVDGLPLRHKYNYERRSQPDGLYGKEHDRQPNVLARRVQDLLVLAVLSSRYRVARSCMSSSDASLSFASRRIRVPWIPVTNSRGHSTTAHCQAHRAYASAAIPKGTATSDGPLLTVKGANIRASSVHYAWSALVRRDGRLRRHRSAFPRLACGPACAGTLQGDLTVVSRESAGWIQRRGWGSCSRCPCRGARRRSSCAADTSPWAPWLRSSWVERPRACIRAGHPGSARA